MGGVATDVMNRTSISGLYAIGEAASTGVHGANRLASNSLLECLVFASQLAHIDILKPDEHQELLHPSYDLPLLEDQMEQEVGLVRSIRAQLPQLMWKNAGISRCQSDLDKAYVTLTEWRSQLAATALYQFVCDDTAHPPYTLSHPQMSIGIQSMAEVLNLVDVAVLIVKSAAWRTESRGGHYRSDYPTPDPEWHFHTIIQGDKVQDSSISPA